MLDVIDDLLAQPESEVTTIRVPDAMERVAFEIMAYISIDTRFYGKQPGARVPIAEALRDVLADTWKGSARRFPIALYPWAWRRRKRADATLEETLNAIIFQRRFALASGRTGPNDILQTMLTARDKVTGKTLPDQNIRHQIVTFLGASLETNASALSYALYEIATRPEVGCRLAEEVDCVLGRDTDRQVTAGDLPKLAYTERVFKEVLRLHPPGAIVLRHVAHDTLLAGKHRVHKDEKIAVFMPSLHRNPRYWPDPDGFDADRFLPAAASARHPHAYHPFGMGMRHCTGSQLATIEAKLILARLYQRFRPCLEDPSYVLRDVYTDTAKPSAFSLRLQPRAVAETASNRTL